LTSAFVPATTGAELAAHFRYVGHHQNKPGYHLSDIIESLVAPSDGKVRIGRWLTKYSKGSLVNSTVKDRAEVNGIPFEWEVSAACWGGTGSEDSWKNSSMNRINGLSPGEGEDDLGKFWAIKLHSRNSGDRRIYFKFREYDGFKIAYKDFTGNDY
uniref:hypothetical protein n=1 Tax=Roseivirga sp. TaxID=1964215 RepID=UPI0040487ADD